MLTLSDFQYELPRELVAAYPARPRDASRLMVLPPGGPVMHERFRHLPDLLAPGDLLVFNDTRVIKARLLGKRPGGGKAEVFLLRPLGGASWEALVRPGSKLPRGSRVSLSKNAFVYIAERTDDGKAAVRLEGPDADAFLARWGHVPLPPYIKRDDEPGDERRYQTVYADKGFSVAAPTAGLHFTPRVLKALGTRKVSTCHIRLDVGAGTFKPVTTEDINAHRMDFERYFISAAAARRINEALSKGRRVVAVGTTVTRSLEDQMLRHGRIMAGNWETDMFITPGYKFKAISGIVTNFHLPGSTLIMLVSALCGREPVLAAYQEAVKSRYRFYSYGDAMLAWKRGI